jgi:predicted phosphodiesterase
MLIGFVGDVHGRVLHALALLVEWQRRSGRRLDLVIQVGDMGAYPDPERMDAPSRRYAEVDPAQLDFTRLLAADGALAAYARRLRGELAAPLHFIRGNHEDFEYLRGLPIDAAAGSAPVDRFDLLRHVPDGTVLERGGLRIGVLGGAEAWPGGGDIDGAAYAALMARAPGSVDVLVTHEGQHGTSTGFRGDVQGSRMVTALANRLQPRYHVAGHVHHLIGPQQRGGATYLGTAALVASARWEPDATGLLPGCLAVLDTERDVLEPVLEAWLAAFPSDRAFEDWCATAFDGATG